MAQIARPSVDSLVGLWQTGGGLTNGLFAQINEIVASDASFIKSEDPAASSPVVVKLSSLTDPLVSTGPIVRYRYGRSGSAITMLVELRQAYVSEASKGTLIASQTHNDAPNGSYLAGTFTLTAAEADAITNYASLFLRFVADAQD